jgi:phosphonate transport system substrate-binding protein
MKLRALSTMLLVLTACPNPKPVPTAEVVTAAPAGTFNVGMVASTDTAAGQAQVFADFVKKATGKQTRAVVLSDYEQLAVELAKGTVDVAFMPPLAYVRVQGPNKVQTLLKLIRNGQGSYRSVLFGHAGKSAKSLDEFKNARNMRVAWVDPSSAAGYLFAKAMLLRHKIDPAGIFVSQDFLQTHDAVCEAVAEGKSDVGATFNDDPIDGPATHANGCQHALGAKVDQLQIIAATEPIPNDVLVVRAGFPEDAKGALLTAAGDLEKTPEGKKILMDAFHGNGFGPVSDNDFASVRAATDVFKQ